MIQAGVPTERKIQNEQINRNLESGSASPAGSQITPKTFLRYVNYGDSFAFDFGKTA